MDIIISIVIFGAIVIALAIQREQAHKKWLKDNQHKHWMK